MVFGTVSSGFKSGGFNNALATVVIGQQLIFQPETSTNYELGVKSQFFDRKVTFNATLFRLDIDNYQERGQIGLTSTTRNVGAVRQQGVEIDGSVRPIDHVRLNGAVTYIDSDIRSYCGAPIVVYLTAPAPASCPGFPANTRDASGERLTLNPKWQAVIGATVDGAVGRTGWRWALLGDINFTTTQNVSANIDNGPLTVQNGYALLDARLTLTSPRDRWTIGVFGRNLTDKGYCTFKAYQTLGPQLGLNYDSNGDGVNDGTATRCFLGTPRVIGATAGSSSDATVARQRCDRDPRRAAVETVTRLKPQELTMPFTAFAKARLADAEAPPVRRPFLYNYWYVAAWAEELDGATILGRKLLNVPVALFRREDGGVAALLDACPHKYAPLSMGKRLGDTIECSYHGLQFDGAGRCVHNPHGSHRIPPNSTVPTYPVVERHGAIWIWLGDAALADDAAIPDFGFFTDPGRKAILGKTLVEGNYQLSIDNLMDLGHGLYLHRDTGGDFDEPDAVYEVGQDGAKVWDRRLYPAAPVPGGLAAIFQIEPGTPQDVTADIEWLPGGLIQNQIMIAPVGQARVTGRDSKGIHCLTPETEHTTHYFFANVRNFAIDDERIDAKARHWQQQALTNEDSTMVAAIERNMADLKGVDIGPVYLETDNAMARVRRLIEMLRAREAMSAEQ